MLTYYTLKKLREEREKNRMNMESTEQEIQNSQDFEFSQEFSPTDELSEMTNESQEVTNEQLDEKPKKK